MSPALATSLTAIGTIMADARDPWWIIASAAVALHGADPGPVSDVDVLLGIDDAKRILPMIGVEAGEGSAHASFRSSIFGVWDGTALPAEFMADFHHLVGKEWLPVRPQTRRAVVLDGVALFVPDRTELAAMLAAFGRPKDIERARRLTALR